MVPLSCAIAIATRAHRGQKRADGSDYIEHPLAVAQILMEASTHLPTAIYAAAVLHDVIEDTPLTFRDLSTKVGRRIATLVLGLTRPRMLYGEAQDSWERRYLQQMLSVQHVEPGILLIKIADRIHNLETAAIFDHLRRQALITITRSLYIPFFVDARYLQPPEWRIAYDALLARLAHLLIAHDEENGNAQDHLLHPVTLVAPHNNLIYTCL